MRKFFIVAFICVFACSRSLAWTHGGGTITPPLADTVCTVTTGNCTGVGAGSSLFTAANCNGIADDAAAFNSFNTFAVGTWQVAHPGLLMELDIPAGKDCEFNGVDVNHNKIGAGILKFQMNGNGSTMGDFAGTGGGFFLGCQSLCGVQFTNTASVRLATVSAGASTITLLDTSKCSLFNSGNSSLIAGIDPQGFGDPPNPQVFEWITISSTASCAGSGAIALSAPLAFGYKSTWPLYNAGDVGHSDGGGPATLYQLYTSNRWDVTHAYYNLTINQRSQQTNADGKNISFYNITCSSSTSSCLIPSQNLNWNLTNVSASSVDMEFDKIVANVTMNNVNFRQIIAQSGSGPQNWTCNNCTINNSLNGTPGITTFSGGSVASLQLGATSFGVSGSFTATNTVISALQLGGANQSHADTIGVWSGSTLTVPQNMNVSVAASCGTTCTQFTVTSTAGWSNGLTVAITSACGQYSGNQVVTVIDSTHISIPVAFTTTCSGSIGNLPLNWAVPRANVALSSYIGVPLGPYLQVSDIASGANNSTVVTFTQNGSAISGFPVLPNVAPFGTLGYAVTAHQAPSFSCVGCTGAQAILDVNSASASGLPFGSYMSRVVTSANNANNPMNTFGQLTELDVTVSNACSGASNMTFFNNSAVTFQTTGSHTTGTWLPTVNAAIANGTPRVMTPTTTSGAQSGDSLVAPGANTWLFTGIISPWYSTVGNCGTASTTFTVKTNQGVVYP